MPGADPGRCSLRGDRCLGSELLRPFGGRYSDDAGAEIDLTLTMTGFAFAEVDAAKVAFRVDDVSVPVSRLAHIVRSKMLAGRAKDQLFLTSHRALLERLLRREGGA